MNRILILIVAIVMFVAMISCERTQGKDGNMATVTLSVTSSSILTKSGQSDEPDEQVGYEGYYIRYILEIYYDTKNEGDWNDFTKVGRLVNYEDGNGTVFSTHLTKSPNSYYFAIWADYVIDKDDSNLYYNAGDLRTIELIDVIDSGFPAFAESPVTRDAFFTNFSAKVESDDFTHTAILKRPFAQINTYTADLDNQGEYVFDNQVINGPTGAVPASLTPVFVNTVYTGEMYTQFNAFTDEVSGLKEVSVYAPVVNNTIEWSGLECRRMTSDYLLAPKFDDNKLITDPDEGIHMTQFTATYFNADGNMICEESRFINIKYRRNWRTKVYGLLLSNTATIVVNINSEFDGELVP